MFEGIGGVVWTTINVFLMDEDWWCNEEDNRCLSHGKRKKGKLVKVLIRAWSKAEEEREILRSYIGFCLGCQQETLSSFQR